MTPALDLDALVGFRVDGRHGRLGVVIGTDADGREAEAELLVRGGSSDALYYHVPASCVTGVSNNARTVTLDVDVIDFTPRLREDGSVDLHLVAE